MTPVIPKTYEQQRSPITRAVDLRLAEEKERKVVRKYLAAPPEETPKKLTFSGMKTEPPPEGIPKTTLEMKTEPPVDKPAPSESEQTGRTDKQRKASNA
jgi:hypothetical protein